MVGLVWNLNTNHMSRQFCVAYDNIFQTFHSAKGEPPAGWPDLLVFDLFRSDFDDSNWAPGLADKWLTPFDPATRHKTESNLCVQSINSLG